MRIRVLTPDVRNDQGEPRRTPLINRDAWAAAGQGPGHTRSVDGVGPVTMPASWPISKWRPRIR